MSFFRGIWNRCKKLCAIQKIHQFYTISGLIRQKLEETYHSKIITHMPHLKEHFPDIDIDNFLNFLWNSLLIISG